MAVCPIRGGGCTEGGGPDIILGVIVGGGTLVGVIPAPRPGLLKPTLDAAACCCCCCCCTATPAPYKVAKIT